MKDVQLLDFVKWFQIGGGLAELLVVCFSQFLRLSVLCLSEWCKWRNTVENGKHNTLKNEEGKNNEFVDPVKLPLISLKILKQMIAVLFESWEMTGWWLRAGWRIISKLIEFPSLAGGQTLWIEEDLLMSYNLRVSFDSVSCAILISW